MSLKEIETGKVKDMRHEDEMNGGAGVVEGRSFEGIEHDEFKIEITDPSDPAKRPTGESNNSTQDMIWTWVNGTTQVTVDKTRELSKLAALQSKRVIESEYTKNALLQAGAWWEKDVNVRVVRVGGWWNNVATRVTRRGEGLGSQEEEMSPVTPQAGGKREVETAARTDPDPEGGVRAPTAAGKGESPTA
mmetsp:Transcript_39729/g.63700  ORF Transcript_39729/g.63700 Transcript_39729/m.63700 type:complete len:190 (-) Transcript_39729:500-1069(-)